MYSEARLFGETTEPIKVSAEVLEQSINEILIRNIQDLLQKPESFLGCGMTARVHEFPESPEYCVKMITAATKRQEYEFHSLVVPIAEEAELLHEVSHLNPGKEEIGVRVPRPIASFKTKDAHGHTVEVLVMERMHAVSLKDVLERRCPLPNTFDQEIFFTKLRLFIARMHDEVSVFHRDLHEGNIMVDLETGMPIIIDFGLGYKAMRSEGDQDIYTATMSRVTHRLLDDMKQVDKLEMRMRNF